MPHRFLHRASSTAKLFLIATLLTVSGLLVSRNEARTQTTGCQDESRSSGVVPGVAIQRSAKPIAPRTPHPNSSMEGEILGPPNPGTNCDQSEQAWPETFYVTASIRPEYLTAPVEFVGFTDRQFTWNPVSEDYTAYMTSTNGDVCKVNITMSWFEAELLEETGMVSISEWEVEACWKNQENEE